MTHGLAVPFAHRNPLQAPWAFAQTAGARAHVPDVPMPTPPIPPPLPEYPPGAPPETPTQLPPDIREPEVPDEVTPPAGDPPRQPSPIVTLH